jgi:hypothetical protein
LQEFVEKAKWAHIGTSRRRRVCVCTLCMYSMYVCMYSMYACMCVCMYTVCVHYI